ncbi:Ger(x)C family spore germination protein [Desertibacillus haloalkaliphilus]|uniref:Ger(x)C family spore germination protein n=1 Tax=Desertibacillus haloalkaliphilus TaxID=1328930 RepID=UPI001C272003|nr:Ger(x)C family spore germination protein [Desertibacillus haloalkaliphilus]MBU8906604.1 Ger(x)C family spore germination protein [Desertibacillus haloalkaliphilus]
MKKRLLLLLIFIVLFVQVGCWDRIEVNDVAVVSATSIDRLESGKFIVGEQIPLPGAMGGAGSEGGGGGTTGGDPFYVDAGVGESVRRAQDDLQQRLSRSLRYGHRRVILFGKDAAKAGLGKKLDVLTRNIEGRLTTNVFMTEGQAIDVIAVNPELEQLGAEAIREIGNARYEQSIGEFLKDFQRDGMDPMLPVVDVAENNNPNPEARSEQVQIKRVGIFKEDQLEFITTEKESKGVSWMMELMHGNYVTLPVGDRNYLNIWMKDQTATIDYEIENDKPKFLVTIDTQAMILENQSDLNLEEPSVFDTVEKALKEEIEGHVNEIFTATLSRGIDTFGLGWLLRRREPNKWKEWKEHWRELLPELEIEITVESPVQATGLTSKGIGVKE